ncbi:MAG: hypothetical protein WKF75_08340 [Singulisphaera sp.]
MTPQWVLLLCFAGFNVGVAYAWWIAIRPTLFRADLQAIRAKLDSAMKAEGKMDDIYYLQLRKAIAYLIDKAPPSFLMILLSLHLRGPDRRDTDAPLPDWFVEGARRLMQREGIHPAVEQAKLDVLRRLVIHFVLSPGTYLALLLVLVSGKTKGFYSLLSAMLRGVRAIDSPLPFPTRSA